MIIDTNRRVVVVDGNEVRVSRLEWRALQAMQNNAGRVVTKDTLASAIYGDAVYDGVSDEMVEKVVNRLRNKIMSAGGDGVIQTRRGFGYILNVTHDVGVADEIRNLLAGMPDSLQRAVLEHVRALAEVASELA